MIESFCTDKLKILKSYNWKELEINLVQPSYFKDDETIAQRG